MAPKPSRGGRLGVSGEGSPLVRIQVRIEGIEKTTDEFKQIRRGIDEALRAAMTRAGERTVIPIIKSGLPRKDPSDKRGLPVGAMASSITIKRDRLDVVIKSSLPKRLDRALGWLDFGGKRARDTKVRVGPHVIVSSLDAKSDAIDQAVLDELAHQFAGFDFARG